MKALVKYKSGPGNMEIREVPVPEPGQGEVLISVKAVGICGTDLKIQDDQFPSFPPVIVGHEFSGEIAGLGRGVRGWKIGDRVVSEQHTLACGICSYCLTGNRHLCPEKRSPGYGVDGAFADYIKVPASLLHRIPEGLSHEEATLVEPMAVAAFGILDKTGIQTGDHVVILGCGPIAILALQMIRAHGAAKVLMTGTDMDTAMRFSIATEFGAEHTVNVMEEDPVKAVMEKTGGVGADLVIDLSGSSQAIIQGLDMLRKEGRFCALGLPHGEVPVPWTKLVLKAARIQFSFSSGYQSWEWCLFMIRSGKVRLERFTKDIFPLECWKEAFDLARSGKTLKVIIKPGMPGQGRQTNKRKS